VNESSPELITFCEERTTGESGKVPETKKNPPGSDSNGEKVAIRVKQTARKILRTLPPSVAHSTIKKNIVPFVEYEKKVSAVAV
jgi:hypothetical protein